MGVNRGAILSFTMLRRCGGKLGGVGEFGALKIGDIEGVAKRLWEYPRKDHLFGDKEVTGDCWQSDFCEPGKDGSQRAKG